jgi:hypothetical protein
MFGGLSVDVVIVGFFVLAGVAFIIWINRK